VDFGENGILDIIVLVDDMLDPIEPTSSKSIHAVYNNYFNDAYFFKTLGSNGVCNAWCSSGPKFPSPKPYGVNMAGAVWKYTVNDLAGTLQVAQGVQLHQSGYLALQTPYILFGLGRTNNYIENLYYGVSIKSSKAHYFMWQGLIPNSQVVAFPYSPSDPPSWTLELYLRLSGVILWVMVTVVVLLLLLSIAIYFFRWKEKREDRLMKQETAHLFHQ